MRNFFKSRWFTYCVLVLGGGTIFKLSSLKDAFYVPMQEIMGLSHTQIGVALSVFGLVQTIGNFFSIYISDRFSKKILIPIGLIGTGFIGFYLSTFPSYYGIVAAWGLMALFAEVIYWPVLLKAIRLLGDASEQGRLFGFLEAGRGVIDIIVAFSALGIFVTLGSGPAGFRAAILFFAIIVILVGILSYFLLEDDVIKTVDDQGNKISKNKAALQGVGKALRTLDIWMISFTIFCAYSMYIGLTYFIPFLKDVYGLPVALVGAYGIVNQYGLKIIGGPTGGFLSDKLFKSPTKYLRFCFLLAVFLLIGLSALPHESMNVYLGMACTLGFGVVVFTMRAIFFAPVEEVGIPRDISGAAMSIVCILGYSPNVFAFTLYGSILDKYPGMEGYRYVFLTMAGFAALGFVVSNVLLYIINKKKSQIQA